MDITEERSLADAPTTVDDSPAVTPETFDLDRWIEGVRPTRRKVKLFPSAHLIARLEELADRIDSAPEDADVDALVEEFDRLRAQVRDGVWFTIEKRSSEWVDDHRKKAAKAHRIKLDDDGEAEGRADRITLSLEQLAAQIIEPAGVTADHLRTMLDHNEGELNKLIVTLDIVQRQLAENAGVLNRDFSERLSRARRTS